MDDIAFMRALVDSGGKSAARGAGMIAAIGVLFGLASLFHWAVQNRFLPFPIKISIYVWTAAFVLTAILAIAQNRNTPRGTTPDKVYRAARLAVSLTILGFWLALAIAAWRLHDPDAMVLFAPMVFALYGGFWVVFSSVHERRGWRWVPVCSFFAVIVLALLIGTPHLYLANAFAMCALFVIPGIMLALRQRASGNQDP